MTTDLAATAASPPAFVPNGPTPPDVVIPMDRLVQMRVTAPGLPSISLA